MAIDTEVRTSRRGLIAAALGGAGALIAARLGQPSIARAADGGNALLGTANTSTTETGFQNTDAGEVSLHALQTTGTAVRADATDATVSTFVDGSYRSGVVATVGGTGVAGEVDGIAASSDESAVYGYSNVSDLSNGVWGDSWVGTGVYGTGTWGVYGLGYDGVTGIGTNNGVYGRGSVGVRAVAATSAAYALLTDGKIRFNGRSGRTTITSGHQYKDVVVAGMTTASWVLVTLGTYKSGYSVAAAISYAGKFRMYLNKSATSTMYFSYIVIN